MTTDPSFRMTVQDVFTIHNKGIVITGRIETGTLNSGDAVSIQRPGYSKKAIVASIEIFRKVTPQASAGATVGLFMQEVAREDIQRGDVLIGSDQDNGWIS